MKQTIARQLPSTYASLNAIFLKQYEKQQFPMNDSAVRHGEKASKCNFLLD